MSEQPQTHVRVIRPHRVVERAPSGAAGHLRRALGVVGVYAMGYGDVGSSIYYALGIVAAYALGATPIALALGGIIFILTAMTYAEGVTMVPTAGGSVAFSRRAFNDLFSFISGWALALNYAVTTSISAVSASFYLAYFWPLLKEQPGTAAVGGIVISLLLMLLNIRGVRETAKLNISFAAVDLMTQGLLVVLGIGLILGGWRNLLAYHQLGPEYWPSSRQLMFAVGMSMVAYVGLESASQMAEETKTPTRTVPRAFLWSVITVMFAFIALPTLALSAMPPSELLAEWSNDPIAGIASKLPDVMVNVWFARGTISLSAMMMPWVAILAFTILVIAANAGILAGSRVTYNMAQHRQLFAAFAKVHPRSRTPYVAILAIAGTAVTLIMLGMGRRDVILRLGELYVFSATMAFSMAHLSVWLLRIKEPDTPRPFRAPGTVHIAQKPISISATVGFLACAGIWLMLALSPGHESGRNIGLAWLAVGLVFYAWYRRRQNLGLTQTAVTEEVHPLVTLLPAPRRQEMAQRIRHILVPVHSREYADDLARISCDLSQLYTADITAVYAIEVPRSLELEADLGEQTREAQDILDTANHIAETVYDMEFEKVILQARSAGVALVEYANERGTDLILLGAHHGQRRSPDAVVFGSTADYVARNARCAVWTVRADIRPARDTQDKPTGSADPGD
ncbi:MAG: universal stress protein [Armatimonadetes bacterium]|nr:universal stress protein [Armatimonadota bacterium]